MLHYLGCILIGFYGDFNHYLVYLFIRESYITVPFSLLKPPLCSCLFLLFSKFDSVRALDDSFCASIINPNGTSPSEYQNYLCWYTKGQTRIEVFQSTIDGHDLGCIYLLNQLAIYFSKCWVAYATICIATCVHQRTRVFFEQLACHMRVAYINSHVHLSLALNKYKTWLFEISWALIFNHPNCFNHPSLRNYSICQSINRGLGVGNNQSILESKVMLVVYLQKFLEQQNSESFGCRGVLVSEARMYSYLIHWLLIKRVLLLALCWVYFMYCV